MDDLIKVGKRYFPLHAVAHIDDDGEHVILTIKDVKSGPSEFRLLGEEGARLRSWLDERVGIALAPETRPDDAGVRDDD